MEIEYTEEEEAIKSYLEGGMEDMLAPEILEKIIGEFWDKEPFKYAFVFLYFIFSYQVIPESVLFSKI